MAKKMVYIDIGTKNGQMKVEYTYKDNKLDGLCRAWHENGKLWEDGIYKDGIKYGLYIERYKNGLLRQRCTFKNGKTDGLCRAWHKKRTII